MLHNVFRTETNWFKLLLIFMEAAEGVVTPPVSVNTRGKLSALVIFVYLGQIYMIRKERTATWKHVKPAAERGSAQQKLQRNKVQRLVTKQGANKEMKNSSPAFILLNSNKQSVKNPLWIFFK